MSYDDFEQMELFEESFADDSHTEVSISKAISDFQQFIPDFLLNAAVDVPAHALQWTQSDFN